MNVVAKSELSTAWLDDLNYLRAPEDLPRNAHIGLYGDGQYSRYLISVIENERPDVSIDFVVTTNKEGTYKGRPMMTVDAFLKAPPACDMLVLTPLVWIKDILRSLAGFPAEKIYVSTLVDCTNILTGYQPERADPDKLGAKEVGALLLDDESRREWAMVTGSMVTRDVSECLRRFHRRESEEMHYTEFAGLRPGDCVVEGGILDGETTSKFSQVVGTTGMVYAFDPLGTRYAAKNLPDLGKPTCNVEVIAKALWSRDAQLSFVDQGAFTVTLEKTDGTAADGEWVDAVSVDSFASARGLTHVDFIKLDTEGAEPNVLAGAAKTIKAMRPFLAISIYHTRDQYFSIPLTLAKELDDYAFILRCYSPAALEVILYACPKEKLPQLGANLPR